MTIYNGGTTARTALANWDVSGNLTNTGNILTTGSVGVGTVTPTGKLNVVTNNTHNGGATFDSTGTTQAWFRDTDAGSNLKNWGIQSSGGEFNILKANDDRASGFVTPLTIDTSGRVTAPYQPAFHVRVNQNAYLNTSPLPFATSVFDIGANFNTSTYRFTAPVAGRYGFLLVSYAKIASAGGNSVWKLRVNASDRQYSEYQNPAATAYLSVSAQAIFNLSVGDYVDVAFSGSQTYYAGSQETNFFGWLIG